MSFLSFLRITQIAWRSRDLVTVHVSSVTLRTVLHHANVLRPYHCLNCTRPSFSVLQKEFVLLRALLVTFHPFVKQEGTVSHV